MNPLTQLNSKVQVSNESIQIYIIMSLLGRNILIVGGNGYAGNYFASRLIKQKANVSILCRKGIKHQYPENKQVQWMIGDILEPAKYQTQINQADTIIHTIGTLFDTTITKGSKPGANGSYEQVNLETFRSLLNVVKDNKKIIYLSGSKAPPFIPRYLSTKREAEDLLLNSTHDGYTLRPGFIYDWNSRWWSIPLKYDIQLWNGIHPWLFSVVQKQTFLQKIGENLKQDDPTSLQQLGDTVVEIIQNGYEQKIIKNSLISKLSEKYQKNQTV